MISQRIWTVSGRRRSIISRKNNNRVANGKPVTRTRCFKTKGDDRGPSKELKVLISLQLCNPLTQRYLICFLQKSPASLADLDNFPPLINSTPFWGMPHLAEIHAPSLMMPTTTVPTSRQSLTSSLGPKTLWRNPTLLESLPKDYRWSAGWSSRRVFHR